ncbi:pectate lyase [Sphingomonas sp. R86521]|uniref:pectate lyase n=1 Tax=Sphingomonas sp. R86521 TaxID=3093860 RepID=UPI0036D3649B
MTHKALFLTLLLASPASARVIGKNTPAEPVTAGRIAQLPATKQGAWKTYLQRSEAQMKADRASLVAELKPGQTPPPPPLAVGGGEGQMPLDRDAAWYAGPEARAVADTIVSFQTPAGGWSKNQSRAVAPRLPGQRYANDAETMNPDRSNFDAPNDRFWTFVGTLDNDATTQEIKFLTRVATATPGAAGAKYRASIVKGVRYLLAAQYPNGGWPQIYPLEGGFHDGITFNDNAVAQAAMLLQAVATDPAYRFVPAALRSASASAVRRAVDVILAAQAKVSGRGAGWPQQVDALTLAPISARNYEPRSIASGETTDILLFLMQQPKTPAIVRAVDDGIAWLKGRAIYDQAWTGKGTPEGRRIVPQKGAGPIWSRNYDLVTGQPIFGDKDQSIHDDVNDISIGRRNGYNWYVTQPQDAIAAYEAWRVRAQTVTHRQSAS